MEGNGKKSELKKPATALKKVGSFKAESETQTAVAVRVPSFNQKEANEAAEKIITDEQSHSASMARKRRLMTKNRAQGVRTREKTPEPSKSSIAHEDTTTTDEDEAKSPKSQSEKEADDIYAEMRRKLMEKNNERDNDDLDIDAIREAKYEEAKERRRRSISPFALPTKEEIDKLQRRGSFIDPGNKLLSTVTTYVMTPKDEKDSSSRKSSLVRDEGRRDSLLTPPSSASSGQQTNPYQLSTPPSPRKPERPVSASEKSAISDQKTTNQPNTQSIKQSPVTSKPKQSSLKQSTNINTSLVNRPQDPTQKITSVSPNAGNITTAPIQKSDLSNAPPVKPKRSKSGTRSQGRTSESEMSEDQSKSKTEQQPQKPPKPKERRRTIAAIKRSVRERSPAKRSQSAVRSDKPLDVTGIQLTKAGSEIINLLEKARRRSISIPDEDLKLTDAEKMPVDKSRQLMTPNKTPSTPKRGLKITSPKKIEIMSQEEMMESFQKAQRKSMEIERSRRSSGYVDASQSEITSSCYSSSYSEDESDFDITKRSAELTRKLNLLQHEKELTQTKEKKTNVKKEAPVVEPEDPMKIAEAEAKMTALRVMFRNARRVWKVFIVERKADYDIIKALRNRCFNDFIILLIFCGLGGFIFRYTEGAFENFYKCGVRRVKRDFIDSLWQGSHNMREDDWKSMARKKLWEFESQLHTAHEAGVHSYSGQKSWSFLNSVVYCLTVVTTIGYGHIAPSTTTGRAITIVYAVLGIPIFLILLADFGKLFTRCIKFLWAFVRRLYYTGSCRKVRKTVQVQEVMKGLNMVYEAASTFRRPSQCNLDDPEAIEEQLPPKLPPKPQSPKPQTPSSGLLNIPPIFKRQASEEGVIDVEIQTPAPSAFEIDDEFNLPISVAIICLIIYIFMGASIYVVWEDWGFFESFYFVFISMSTIGFGDFVPNHPMYMMGSIVYLVFGMALTSMCINVVQVKLSDSFRQASAKIGATIGLRVSEEDGSMAPITPAPVEIPAVHSGGKPPGNDGPVAV